MFINTCNTYQRGQDAKDWSLSEWLLEESGDFCVPGYRHLFNGQLTDDFFDGEIISGQKRNRLDVRHAFLKNQVSPPSMSTFPSSSSCMNLPKVTLFPSQLTFRVSSSRDPTGVMNTGTSCSCSSGAIAMLVPVAVGGCDGNSRDGSTIPIVARILSVCGGTGATCVCDVVEVEILELA